MSSVILRATSRYLTPVILAFSFVLLVRGHNAPGGGFIAALVAGAAVVLRYLATGSEGAHGTIPVAFATLLGTGLAISTLTGLVALFSGAAFLEGAIWRGRVPLLGELKVTSSLGFDIGVYLVVLAVIVAIIEHLGREDA